METTGRGRFSIARIKRQVKDTAWDLSSRLLVNSWNMPVVEKFFQTKDEGNIQRASEMWRRPGSVIVMVANHQSHADAIPVTQIARQIAEGTDRSRRFLLVTAATLDGGQNSAITAFTHRMEPWCNSQGVDFAEVVTENDVSQRGASPNAGSAGLRKLLSAKRYGQGIIILPEGTVKGGRFVEENQEGSQRRDFRRNGMQPAASNFGGLLSRIAKPEDIIIVPIGIDGSYNVFDPSTSRPTKSVIEDFVNPRRRKQVQPVATVNVGAPFVLNDFLAGQKIKPGDTAEMATAIMRQVAGLVSVGAQGVYKVR